MNIYQRVILILGAIALVLVLWIAPKYIVENGVKYDYSLILKKIKEAPPENTDKINSLMSVYSPSIDLPKTSLRMVGVVGVTTLLYFAFSKLDNPHAPPLVRFFKWISFPFVKLFYFLRTHKKIFFSLIAVIMIVVLTLVTPFPEKQVDMTDFFAPKQKPQQTIDYSAELDKLLNISPKPITLFSKQEIQDFEDLRSQIGDTEILNQLIKINPVKKTIFDSLRQKGLDDGTIVSEFLARKSTWKVPDSAWNKLSESARKSYEQNYNVEIVPVQKVQPVQEQEVFF
jgi:hypothetical protein